jgi:hypothetical protein
MAVAYFQVSLSVQPKEKGQARLVPPSIMAEHDHQYIIVKDGGKEGIVKLEAPTGVIKEIQKDKDCKKLTTRQMQQLKKSYPSPKLKKKYRVQEQRPDVDEAVTVGGGPVVDATGSPIVDTFQTVRAGFYMIDVPVMP